MKYKGTKSEENLLKAFAGESQARNRYTYYAEKAKEEGDYEIADLFERMANNERTHAKIWFKMLNEIESSDKNLQTAAMGESYEWYSMYPEFAKQAHEDGFPELAMMFEKVAGIEKNHESTFIKAIQAKNKAKKIVTATPDPIVVVEKNKIIYRCAFCGDEQESPLDVCLVCQAIGAYQRV